MSTSPLYTALTNYSKKQYSSFHTPGHKCARFFPDDLLSLDLTELPDTDALFEADGILADAEHRLAELFGTKRSLISAGGCSLAIQAMLRIASRSGNRILMARNAHRSAVNACALLGLEPFWLLPHSDSPLFTGVIRPQDVYDALQHHDNITACYITSPDYYGELSDIAAIADICHKHNVLLLTDNAHGSHLAFLRQKLHPIALGADMSACSLHKTLPVLTGGAVLNIGNARLADNAKDAMALFGSTSPSYPIMASIDLCTAYMNDIGKAQYADLADRINRIKALAAQCGLTMPSAPCDPLRVCINTSHHGISGNAQTGFFHDHQIEPEFCDGDNAVFICTPFNSETDFLRLEQAIRDTGKNTASSDAPHLCHTPSLPHRHCSVREAVMADSECVPIGQTIGRIAADSACPCPPGVPVVMPGERVDAAVTEQLKAFGFKTLQCVK